MSMAETTDREHSYHAEATVLSGNLELPLNQEIHPQAFAKLPEKGGYLAQQSKDFRLESVISYASAHTQVTGNRETKPGHGWATLVTSVVEELNILDVITADRVVAQLSTEHPLHGYIPSVTFLGTRFENLRIAGHKVDLDLDLCLFGDKPENDAPYTKDKGFVDRISRQHESLRGHQNPLAEILARYNRVPTSFENAAGDEESVECSLVHKAEGSYPGRTFGHVIDVPNFGVIYLATVRLEHGDYHPESRVPRKTTVHLDMIHAKMGCLATGKVQAASARASGTTHP
jgi:hypothetical protein